MAGIEGDPTVVMAKQAVGRIVRHIQDFKRFNVSEILEAGSLGDGTVVHGHYDIDLVVYSRGFTGMDVLRSPTMFKPWISQLKEFMQDFPGVQLHYHGEKAESYSVQFSYEISRGILIEVDLLVSPYWNRPEDFYKFLREVPHAERKSYSVCASKWQREFFKRQDQIVKVYICRAKAWRNRVWGARKEGKPKSYLLSLLVVRAYETSDKRNPQSVTQALKALVKDERKDVYWADRPGDFYKRSDYKDLLPSRPRIVDPANPANNLWVTGFAVGDHHILVQRIDSIDLSRPI
jgi:hypothetical protein